MIVMLNACKFVESKFMWKRKTERKQNDEYITFGANGVT